MPCRSLLALRRLGVDRVMGQREGLFFSDSKWILKKVIERLGPGVENRINWECTTCVVFKSIKCGGLVLVR